jgi:replicative DNA helicase
MDLTNLNRDKKNRRKTPPDLSTMIYGKVPPQAKDMEEAVLGAIMLERDAFKVASEVLKAECFYVDSHQRIFKAMESLSKKGQPIDIPMVVEELRTREELDLVGGPYYVTKLTNSVVSSAHTRAHAETIFKKFKSRELIRIAGECLSDAYEDYSDPDDVLSDLERSVKQVSSYDGSGDIRHLNEVLIEVVQEVEENSHRKEDEWLTGVPSGFKELDRITCGFQDTDLIILAARPSKGKTATALQIAKNSARILKEMKRKRTGVGILSIEMKDKQNGQRMLASEAKMYLSSIRGGRLNEEQKMNLFTQGIQKLSALDIWICDKARPALQKVRNTVRKMVEMGCGLIVIDYLQLINGVEGESNVQNREREIANISASLKGLGKELNVPIIALSQLSRDIEKRSDQEPQLSDLRESGALEQDADLVMFLFGHSKKEIEEDADKGRIIYLKIAKHRNGELGKIVLDFDKRTQSISEIGPVQNSNASPGPNYRRLTEEETFPDMRTESQRARQGGIFDKDGPDAF